MPRLPHLLLPLLLLGAPLAPAQVTPAPSAPTAAPDVRELSPTERTAYAKSIAEASQLIKDRRYTDAIARLDALLKERPREPQARFLRATAEADQGRTDEAMAALAGLVADFPELPEPWNNLAVIHAQKGDYESARVALESAIRVAPGWSVAQENLGDVYARLAAAAYDNAARSDRDNKTAGAKLAAIREMFSTVKPPTK
jgi:Flp pilus assembly protein TadD